MGLVSIARVKGRNAGKAPAVVGVGAMFVLVAGGFAAIEWVPTMFRDSDVTYGTLALLNSLRQPGLWFGPLIGIVLGYNAISGDRESGRIKLALGLPNSRAELVIGSFLGLSVVAAVTMAGAAAVAGAIAVAIYGPVDVVAYLQVTAMMALYPVVFVASSVGFSAAVASRARALAGAVVLYVVFVLGWDFGLAILQYVTVGAAIPEGGLPEWIQFLGLLNPLNGFDAAVRGLVPEYGDLTLLPEPTGAYTQDWIGFLVIAVWIVVPLAIGYRHFAAVDLS